MVAIAKLQSFCLQVTDPIWLWFRITQQIKDCFSKCRLLIRRLSMKTWSFLSATYSTPAMSMKNASNYLIIAAGFFNFQERGVVSGFDQNGSPRGIGIQSWTLDNPAPGPSFGITFKG